MAEMTETSTQTSAEAVTDERPPVPEEPLVEDDLLVEDVSIDGMCGVY